MNYLTVKKFIRFCIVGGTGYLLTLLAFWIMTSLLHWSNTISIIVAPGGNILYNFILHDNWTFRNKTI
jgi:putative flippase GtrA